MDKKNQSSNSTEAGYNVKNEASGDQPPKAVISYPPLKDTNSDLPLNNTNSHLPLNDYNSNLPLRSVTSDQPPPTDTNEKRRSVVISDQRPVVAGISEQSVASTINDKHRSSDPSDRRPASDSSDRRSGSPTVERHQPSFASSHRYSSLSYSQHFSSLSSRQHRLSAISDISEAGGKTSNGIMGGDWLKVISRHNRRGATCSVELIAKLAPVDSANLLSADRTFCTGSTHVGHIDALDFEGECVYTMDHDVVFEGAMRRGHFHGQGTLVYPNQGRVDGTFHNGRLDHTTYTFPDGLVFEREIDWAYCGPDFHDRRFQHEIKYGLRPVCTALKTQHQPTRTIPEGCYDTGDGFYNPRTRCVTSPTTGQIIRIPTNSEAQWIMKNCRKAWDEPVGYRRGSFETFIEEDINYAPLLIEKRRNSTPRNTERIEVLKKMREEFCKRMGSAPIR